PHAPGLQRKRQRRRGRDLLHDRPRPPAGRVGGISPRGRRSGHEAVPVVSARLLDAVKIGAARYHLSGPTRCHRSGITGSVRHRLSHLITRGSLGSTRNAAASFSAASPPPLGKGGAAAASNTNRQTNTPIVRTAAISTAPSA